MLGFLAGVITKQALLLGIVFYCFPIFWWTYNDMDHHISGETTDAPQHDEDSYFLSVRFLMSTGTLLTFMGMGYVALPIDLVPDFIPIFGGMDDAVAKMTAGAGLMMGYLGYHFGTGEVPREFVVTVDVVNQMYNYVVPIVKHAILPVVIPVVKALAVPMKKAAETALGNVLQQAKLHDNVADTVFHSVMEQAKAGAAALGADL